MSANVSPAPPGMRADSSRQTSFKPSQEQIVLLITIALLVVFGVTLPGFASVANLLNLLRSISILGILGLGMGLIVISRGIDLSEVAIMAGSWSVALIEIQKGMPIFWARADRLGDRGRDRRGQRRDGRLRRGARRCS